MNKKDYVTYQQALSLISLGYEGACHAGWLYLQQKLDIPVFEDNIAERECDVKAPTKSEALRFFRDKFNLQGFAKSSTIYADKSGYKFIDYIFEIKGLDYDFSTDARDQLHDSHEEAESACIDKLIEVVKKGENKYYNGENFI
jgi:hypothetical protein